MNFTRRFGAWKRLTEGEECGGIPLEPCLNTGGDHEERRPENAPPCEIWLKGTAVDELFPV